jgi:hypothetical protein
MLHPAFAPIQNTSLPREFRYIRLERARDHNHPEGYGKIAYIMILPLNAEAKIDADIWRNHMEACRVVRKRPHSEDSLGHLAHGPGGSWRFHYDVAGTTADETGYHFGGEKFEPGEYLSIREADGMNIYRVVSVLPLQTAVDFFIVGLENVPSRSRSQPSTPSRPHTPAPPTYVILTKRRTIDLDQRAGRRLA